MGDALDYAHANRVVHRDVKPANILITAESRVKITDFGIARLDSSNLTQEGQLLGTPNYMAPEQIQGKEVDHRADLFSLGVVLYEMLTRHKPFQGENLTVVSHRIVYDHFTPPREYVRDLPPGVDRILGRALEKDPAKRYQRAKEMVDDLRRVVEATAAARRRPQRDAGLSSTMVLPAAAAAAAGTEPGPARGSAGAARRRLHGHRRGGPRALAADLADVATVATARRTPDLAAPAAGGGRDRRRRPAPLLGGGAALAGAGAAGRPAARRATRTHADAGPEPGPAGERGPPGRQLGGAPFFFRQAEALGSAGEGDPRAARGGRAELRHAGLAAVRQASPDRRSG